MSDITKIFVGEDAFNAAMDRQAFLLSAIASGNKGIGIQSFGDIKRLTELNLHKNIPVGDVFEFERETNLIASVGDSTGITAATVNEDAFLAAIGTAHEGVYEATFDGAAWHKEDGTPILLADYGISVTGTPVSGDHVIITETASKYNLVVMDHDKDCGSDEHSVVFLTENLVTYGTIPFSSPQLMIYAKAALPAGSYRFTLSHGAYGGDTGADGTYIFTTTQAIPAGGGIRHSKIGMYEASYTKAQVTSGTISTYGEQPARTSIETGITVAEWNGIDVCVDLGTLTARDAQYFSGRDTDSVTLNFTERNYGGDNRFSHSAALQWLNSGAAKVPDGSSTVSNWWTPKTVFDMPPGGAKLAGFLHGVDPELVSNMGEATIVCEIPSPDRTLGEGNTETLKLKVFLPSMTEIYGGNNISTTEGSKYAFFDGTGNAAKIKKYGSTPQPWFLRSALPGYGYRVRCVDTSGALGYLNARPAYGLPAGLIIKSKIRT